MPSRVNGVDGASNVAVAGPLTPQRTQARIASLEKCIEHLQQTHSDTLRHLHGEVQRLQGLCSDLTMQLSRQDYEASLVDSPARHVASIDVQTDDGGEVEALQQAVASKDGEIAKLQDTIAQLRQELDEPFAAEPSLTIIPGHTRASTSESLGMMSELALSVVAPQGDKRLHPGVARPPSAPPTNNGGRKHMHRASRSALPSRTPTPVTFVSPSAEQGIHSAQTSAADLFLDSSVSHPAASPPPLPNGLASKRSVSVLGSVRKDLPLSTASSKYDLSKIAVLPPIAAPNSTELGGKQ